MKRRDFLWFSFAASATAAMPDQTTIEKARRLLAEAEPPIESSALLVHPGSQPVQEDDERIFLIASITKPMTATAVMLLADRGELALTDRAVKFLPEFSEGDRRDITIEQLLTHASGLPDQLPENVALRKRQAPLSEFVERAMRTPLLFAPGEKYSYQSMGILLAAEIVERITDRPLREFLKGEVFTPLGMQRTALGLGDFELEGLEPSQVEHAEPLYGGASEDTRSWDWNSRYWRDLGAPWGGAHSTTTDIARFLRAFLEPEENVLRPETARLMIQNHTPELDRARGLGFALGPKFFGEHCSESTFGHGGSTGCLAWADPEKDLICVILTSMPARVSGKTVLDPISDMIAAAA